MKTPFRAKCIDVTTGGKNVVVVSCEDAKELDVAPMDRVWLTHDGGKQIAAIVDLTEHYVKKGELGLFKEAAKALKITSGETVFVEPTEKPVSVAIIKRKMDGIPLSAEEIDRVVLDIMEETLSDVELTAFISAMYIRGLNDNETVALTKAIVNSGTTLDLKRRPILDKHCIGGVPGNRTTMLIVPIVAAAGLTIPKTSSRSITSPAGTADSMAVLAPVCFNEAEITDIVTKANGCIVWGGGVNLAAADDKLIKIRHPLNLDPRGVLLASILAKKKAVGATHVLVDIPMGKGAKIATRDEAAILANEFMNIGSRLGMEIQCIVTPGYDPVGKAVGPGLEAREILRILNGETVSPDLLEKSLVMAGLLLEAGGAAKQGMGRQMAAEILQSGKALAKMREIISLQGGNPDVKPGDIHIGDKTYDFIAQESGRIHFINVKHISTIARAAGAPVDAGAGIYLYAEKGDKIVKGEKVFTVYSESERKLAAAQELCEKLQPVEMEKIILGGYSTETKPHVIELG